MALISDHPLIDTDMTMDFTGFSFYRLSSKAVVQISLCGYFPVVKSEYCSSSPFSRKPVKLGPLAIGAGSALILEEWVSVRRE